MRDSRIQTVRRRSEDRVAPWIPLPVSVSVVIPTLNEARNLPLVLPRIPSWVDEVVLVDGGSTDDTVEVARRLRPDVRVIVEERRGKGIALRCGFAEARGDIIVMLDADGSTDPGEIPFFVGALLAGADFVKGSRFMQGGGTDDMEMTRRIGNWGLTRMVRWAFGGSYSDLCYGYNAFWRYVLPLFETDGDGFEIETLMNIRVLSARLRVVELPSFESQRVHGDSNLHAVRDGLRILRVIVHERRFQRRRRNIFAPAPPLGLGPVAESGGLGSFAESAPLALSTTSSFVR